MDMDIHGYPHRKSVDMDMDMDVKFHIHGNPGFLAQSTGSGSIGQDTVWFDRIRVSVSR